MMLPEIRTLYSSDAPQQGEVFLPLLQGRSFRLEQIMSYGAVSPEGFWYDQPENEWVLLACGTATLEFEAGELALQSGDFLLLPAHLKHRVKTCSHDAIWLALHYRDH